MTPFIPAPRSALLNVGDLRIQVTITHGDEIQHLTPQQAVLYRTRSFRNVSHIPGERHRRSPALRHTQGVHCYCSTSYGELQLRQSEFCCSDNANPLDLELRMIEVLRFHPSSKLSYTISYSTQLLLASHWQEEQDGCTPAPVCGVTWTCACFSAVQ